MAALPYMQLYVADYLGDTYHLTTEEHGAYLLLMMVYWQSGKPIHKSRLAAAARMSNDRWNSVERTLNEFFIVDEQGYWIHARIEHELHKVLSKQTQASLAGKASAAKRAQNKANLSKNSTVVKVPLNHTDTDTDTDTDKNKTLTSSNDEESKDFYLTKKKKKLSGKQLIKFNEFWDTFNYKSGKAEAADAWLSLSVTPKMFKQIIEAAQREANARTSLIQSGSTPKMAEGWLSGRRFEDEAISPSSPEYKNPQNFIIPDEWISRGEHIALQPEENEKFGDFKMRILDAESVARATAEL